MCEFIVLGVTLVTTAAICSRIEVSAIILLDEVCLFLVSAAMLYRRTPRTAASGWSMSSSEYILSIVQQQYFVIDRFLFFYLGVVLFTEFVEGVGNLQVLLYHHTRVTRS